MTYTQYMWYLLLFHSNNGYKNMYQCYIYTCIACPVRQSLQRQKEIMLCRGYVHSLICLWPKTRVQTIRIFLKFDMGDLHQQLLGNSDFHPYHLLYFTTYKYMDKQAVCNLKKLHKVTMEFCILHSKLIVYHMAGYKFVHSLSTLP
jgi:hypothetical protein